MKKLTLIVGAAVVELVVSGYSRTYFRQTEPGAFYTGHSDNQGGTQGAPQQSGGTDRNGCHKASVPYHCR